MGINKLSKDNNAFDLLRLILAIFVVTTHGYLIGGYGFGEPLAKVMGFKSPFNLGETGVIGFFALSGYLITASFERYRNPLIFIYHRFFRIVPGFWICLLFTSFVIAPIIYFVNNHSLSAFSWNESLSYVVRNIFIAIKQWNIAYVLDYAAYKESLNGSLWSLFPEVICYAFTLFAGSLGLFRENRIILLGVFIGIFSLLILKSNNLVYGPTFIMLSSFNLIQAYTSYITGCLLYIYRQELHINLKGVIFILIITILLLRFGGYTSVAPILVAIIVIYGFNCFKFKIPFDISYGIYIYSFPFQQLLYSIFGNNLPVYLYLSFSILGSCILGFLSFYLIEKPFINIRKKLDKLISNAFQLSIYN
ncbi:acyltransferase [Nostoc sp. PCC 7107]|uniref:acyltransferase family protein n=1 Tax=Nostoc sp. PCC 7107 TaxID=317936 RepID=UPI00029F03CB|nr:acyltransferase [Nostoc sp. PCC 7107]AFY42841.1 acyltransferase 3 [Nostoc sp. PCC 7107]